MTYFCRTKLTSQCWFCLSWKLQLSIQALSILHFAIRLFNNPVYAAFLSFKPSYKYHSLSPFTKDKNSPSIIEQLASKLQLPVLSRNDRECKGNCKSEGLEAGRHSLKCSVISWTSHGVSFPFSHHNTEIDEHINAHTLLWELNLKEK